MKVLIYRMSGPVTDKEAKMEVNEGEMNAIIQTIAAVNLASNNKEGWTVVRLRDEGNLHITPTRKE